MATSVGEQIVQAIVDALNAPSDTPCVAYRNRVDPFSGVELPACGVFAVEETATRESMHLMKRTRTVRLELVLQGAPPLDSAADPLYVWAVQTLFASDTLAPLIRRLSEAHIVWETEASYDDACVCALDFAVEFTTTNDPTVQV
jgi:hypothetical protein